MRIGATEGTVLGRYRNFYGLGYVAHRVIPVSTGDSYEVNEFSCNGTTHGYQCAQGEWKGMTPTVYYAEHAGGLPVLNHPKYLRREPLRVALCGMGIGTLAAYSRQGDFYRFYEINPAVVEFARNARYFSFLGGASGEVDVVVDDARRALERERANGETKYDVMIVDVFTGDSIPAHMATREAFQLYLDRLASGGIMAFHISNWHLDLIPMVKAVAREFGLDLEVLQCCPTRYSFQSTWAFFSREKLPTDLFNPDRHHRVDLNVVPDLPVMTDDFHSVLPYIVSPFGLTEEN